MNEPNSPSTSLFDKLKQAENVYQVVKNKFAPEIGKLLNQKLKTG